MITDKLLTDLEITEAEGLWNAEPPSASGWYLLKDWSKFNGEYVYRIIRVRDDLHVMCGGHLMLASAFCKKWGPRIPPPEELREQAGEIKRLKMEVKHQQNRVAFHAASSTADKKHADHWQSRAESERDTFAAECAEKDKVIEAVREWSENGQIDYSLGPLHSAGYGAAKKDVRALLAEHKEQE